MSMFDFMDKHLITTIVIVYLIVETIYKCGNLAFKTVNRWMRSRNIKAMGWPPSHLDADGDFK